MNTVFLTNFSFGNITNRLGVRTKVGTTVSYVVEWDFSKFKISASGRNFKYVLRNSDISEDYFFQISTVWEDEIDVYLLYTILMYIKNNDLNDMEFCETIEVNL